MEVCKKTLAGKCSSLGFGGQTTQILSFVTNLLTICRDQCYEGKRDRSSPTKQRSQPTPSTRLHISDRSAARRGTRFSAKVVAYPSNDAAVGELAESGVRDCFPDQCKRRVSC